MLLLQTNIPELQIYLNKIKILYTENHICSPLTPNPRALKIDVHYYEAVNFSYFHEKLAHFKKRYTKVIFPH